MKILSVFMMIAGFAVGAYGYILYSDNYSRMERAFDKHAFNPAILIVIGIAVIILGVVMFLKSRKNK